MTNGRKRLRRQSFHSLGKTGILSEGVDDIVC